jgi:hypothetical protein
MNDSTQKNDHELGKYDCCGFLRKKLAVCAHQMAKNSDLVASIFSNLQIEEATVRSA